MAAARKVIIRYRCWIEKDEERFFGPGRASLLELIDDLGSLSKAAKHMKMSYKKAWSMIADMNSRSRKPFVLLQSGGEKGGGAKLTQAGRTVVTAYRKLLRKLDKVILKEKDLQKLV